MRLVTLQMIWQCCTVILDKPRVSVPSHSSMPLTIPSVNYVNFVTAINEIVFWLCATQNGAAEFGAML